MLEFYDKNLKCNKNEKRIRIKKERVEVEKKKIPQEEINIFYVFQERTNEWLHNYLQYRKLSQSSLIFTYYSSSSKEEKLAVIPTFIDVTLEMGALQLFKHISTEHRAVFQHFWHNPIKTNVTQQRKLKVVER